MNEKWVALAAQIADLKREVEALRAERDVYKAMCDLHDARARIVTIGPADDVIEINLKELA
jgi:hypothetical protein